MSFLRYGRHACIQYCKWGLMFALYRCIINTFSLYAIYLRIIPRIWLPLEAAILHCSETFMLALIVTPKSFSFTVLHIIVPTISLFSPVFPCPACRHLHFQNLITSAIFQTTWSIYQCHPAVVRQYLAFKNPCWERFIKLNLLRKSTVWSLIIISNTLQITDVKLTGR